MDLSCDLEQDTTCPTLDNGICESRLATPPAMGVPGCEMGDCLDCNALCSVFDQDCTGCLANGCFWCPGDATCYNSPKYQFRTKIASCVVPGDFVHQEGPEVCATQGAPFR
jgi:hypothetical protein